MSNNFINKWISLEGRIADIESGTKLYENAVIDTVDRKTNTFFIVTEEGREVTLRGGAVILSLHPLGAAI